VVQVSGGAQARTSSANPSIKIKFNLRENRVDTIFRAGLLALLFFFQIPNSLTSNFSKFSHDRMRSAVARCLRHAPELFGKFFEVIADTMREVLGADWSAEIDEAWRTLLREIDGVLAPHHGCGLGSSARSPGLSKNDRPGVAGVNAPSVRDYLSPWRDAIDAVG
jgi:hypothetical protein